MTPKKKYDERKRLKSERLLRQEQRLAEDNLRSQQEYQRRDDTEKAISSIAMSFERLADVAELWADQQK